MNANDVIESYVTDVAVRLPRKQRNDVAFELRALLNEGLQDKAAAAGRPADADDPAIATEFLRAFGRPEDVAARYRPTLTIIDPADGPKFLRAAVIGLALIWSLGLFACLQQPIHSADDLIRALTQWWGSIVIPSPWWPGVLVVWFGLASWSRRRRPQTGAGWKPRAGDHLQGGRTASALGLAGVLCGLSVLLNPRWLLDFFWAGRAAPAAYEALTYTETFRQNQGPWLLGLLLLNVPILITAIVTGRRPALLRRLEPALALVLCAVMAWTVLDGPVFLTPISDRTAKSLLVTILAATLIGYAIKLYRGVRPTPTRQASNLVL